MEEDQVQANVFQNEDVYWIQAGVARWKHIRCCSWHSLGIQTWLIHNSPFNDDHKWNILWRLNCNW